MSFRVYFTHGVESAGFLKTTARTPQGEERQAADGEVKGGHVGIGQDGRWPGRVPVQLLQNGTHSKSPWPLP